MCASMRRRCPFRSARRFDVVLSLYVLRITRRDIGLRSLRWPGCSSPADMLILWIDATHILLQLPASVAPEGILTESEWRELFRSCGFAIARWQARYLLGPLPAMQRRRARRGRTDLISFTVRQPKVVRGLSGHVATPVRDSTVTRTFRTLPPPSRSSSRSPRRGRPSRRSGRRRSRSSRTIRTFDLVDVRSPHRPADVALDRHAASDERPGARRRPRLPGHGPLAGRRPGADATQRDRAAAAHRLRLRR